MKRKILFIYSSIGKALQFEWLIEGLNLDKFQPKAILINSEGGDFHTFLKETGIPVITISCKSKKD